MPRGSQPHARNTAERQSPQVCKLRHLPALLCIQQRTVGGEQPKERAACPPRTLLDEEYRI